MKGFMSIAEDATIEVDSDADSLYTTTIGITFTHGDVSVTHRVSKYGIRTLMNLLNLATHEVQWREERRKELTI